MRKTFLQLLNEVAGGDEAFADAQKKIDPVTGKRIASEYKSTSVNVFKNKQYKKIIEKFKQDPMFANQFKIIQENNVSYLNKMYSLIKSKDPSIETLKRIFSITKNDSEYFSELHSFIVPLTSIVGVSKKVETEELWDDDNFLTFIRKNVFDIEIPSGNIIPNENNVKITWNNGKDELSVLDFSNSMKEIIAKFQDFEDVKDAIMNEDTSIPKLIKKKQEDIMKEISKPVLLDNLSKFISLIKFRDKDGKEYASLKNLDEQNISKELQKFNAQKTKLEKEQEKNLDLINELKALMKHVKEESELLKKSDLSILLEYFHNAITTGKHTVNPKINVSGISSMEELTPYELSFIRKTQPIVAKVKKDGNFLAAKISIQNIKNVLQKEVSENKISRSQDKDVLKKEDDFINSLEKSCIEIVSEYCEHIKQINEFKQKIEEIKASNSDLEGISKELEYIDQMLIKFNENKKYVENFKDASFQEILNDDSDDITFIFNDNKLYNELIIIKESFNKLESFYNKFSNDSKSILNSPLIKGDYARSSTFIDVIRDLEDVIKSTKDIGSKFLQLKKIINDIKEKGEVPFSQVASTLNKISSKDLAVLYNKIVQIIVKFNVFLRVHGFIMNFKNSQFHTQLDIKKIKLEDNPELEDYYVQVSITPEDSRNQSTHQFWTSCQTLNTGETGLNQNVGSGYLLGNISVFLLALDWSKPSSGGRIRSAPSIHKPVDFKDLDEKRIEEIQKFKANAEKGIQGTKKFEIRRFLRSYAVRAVARVLIKTYELTEDNIRTITPETKLIGDEENVPFMKVVDNLYTPNSKKEINMKTSSGLEYDFDVMNTYANLFYKSVKALAKRLNYNVKPTQGEEGYVQRDFTYDDLHRGKISYPSTIKKLHLGEKINFSRESTEGLLELLKEDKNLLRYKTFRHALFSKDVINGTLDLTGTTIESLDPMHPTNLPNGPGLTNDKPENISNLGDSWMVNDNFRKNSGDFNAPLTKSELALYQRAKVQ